MTIKKLIRSFNPYVALVVAIPMSAVAMGAVLVPLSLMHADALVKDDYYKAGLAIAKDLKRDQEAKARKLSGQVKLDLENNYVRVDLAGNPGSDNLMLWLRHSTRPDLDRKVTLSALGASSWDATIDLIPSAGKWHIEVGTQRWRVMAESLSKGDTVASLEARG